MGRLLQTSFISYLSWFGEGLSAIGHAFIVAARTASTTQPTSNQRRLLARDQAKAAAAGSDSPGPGKVGLTGLTQKEFASLLGVGESTVRAEKQGRRFSSVRWTAQTADAIVCVPSPGPPVSGGAV